MLCPHRAQISTQPMRGAKLATLKVLSQDEVLVPVNLMAKVPTIEQWQDFLLDYEANSENKGMDITQSLLMHFTKETVQSSLLLSGLTSGQGQDSSWAHLSFLHFF